MYRTIFVTAAFVLATSAVTAQSVTGINKPLSFGGALGASMPTGKFGDLVNTGYNGTVILGLTIPSLPLGLRFDVGYNQFDYQRSSTNAHVFSATGNVVVNVPTTSMLRPYLIGGAGLYNTGTSVSGSQSANNFGANAGLGVAMPLSGFNAFIEARFHYVNTDQVSKRFIPITFGVMF